MSDWFVNRMPATAARIRLFCFPYAGASATVFNGWEQQMPSEVELLAIQLPGRSYRYADPLIYSMSRLVERLAAEMHSYDDKPFVFFGHSVGAYVAFELARELQKEGRPSPRHLIISAARAPQLGSKVNAIHNLPHDEFVERIGNFEGTPAEILAAPDLLELFLPALRADMALSELHEYHLHPPLRCDATILGGRRDKHATESELRAWNQVISGKVIHHRFPGGHFFIHESSGIVVASVQYLLSAIIREL